MHYEDHHHPFAHYLRYHYPRQQGCALSQRGPRKDAPSLTHADLLRRDPNPPWNAQRTVQPIPHTFFCSVSENVESTKEICRRDAKYFGSALAGVLAQRKATPC
eukprot:TRINITY_DN52927_c0_g1_i1.p2 TRINITY_DN52927_c0_g1~~TRINITY_DN52927_c0_g1_i1.p2  ORF type:complete len:104 (+),score=3.49 TRINITY_DN52927_c0_g1_i1:126-437(+)